ncbi:MAG: F0F1 ATP synthase subunit B [Candidatus Levybacteria bacterium]|nr:F0F1 ATP synthase subunit B [Candidatus Levybacteria bacterium]
MDIINNFGLDPFLLGTQVVNFLVILFVLKKFLYKPILELLKKRENTIKEGLAQAEAASIRLEKVIEDEKRILRGAQEQAKKIIESAKNEALEVSRQIREDSKKQTEKMISDAQDQIARESHETERRLSVYVSKIATSLLEKALSEFFSEKEQKEVLTKALKIVKKTN